MSGTPMNVSPAKAPWIGGVAVVLLGLLSLGPWISVGTALVLGIAVTLVLGNPWPAHTKTYTPRLLQASVIGLGAGANLGVVARVGLHGMGYTAVGIVVALAFGSFLSRRMQLAGNTGILVAVGTAICGGSAIAAVAPVLRAKSHEVSMALVVVFLLNAVALFVFPWVGHGLHMTEDGFGVWSALAIHDTSSVVGAATQFGPRALEVATAAKLARALWIVPVTLWFSFRAGGDDAGKTPVKKPWFIAGFIAAAAVVTFVPAAFEAGQLIATGARQLLKLTLFLTGLGLTREAVRSLGVRPLVVGVTLWIVMATGTLAGVLGGVIH